MSKFLISKQDYSSKPKIDGVKLIDLPYFRDDGGCFCELGRIVKNGGLKDHFPDFKIKQINWSLLQPGALKAGHMHQKQTDIWFVPPTDQIIVGLIDAREQSPTANVKMRFVMGGGKAQLLYIPPNVIHGSANPYDRPMTLIYLVDEYWDGSDEWRVPWPEFGAGFWEIQKG